MAPRHVFHVKQPQSLFNDYDSDRSRSMIPGAHNQSLLSKKRIVGAMMVLVYTLKDMWRDTKIISRYAWAHWRELWLHIGLGLVSLLALFSSVPLAVLTSTTEWGGRYCAPGGDFDYTADTYNPWDVGHLFQITLGFGKFSFAQAKAIDVAWDIVFGRGGQLILSAITFIVFSKSLNRLLEQPDSSFSYDTFRAIVFEPPSLIVMIKFYKDIRSRTDQRARWSLTWFVFASLYVVAFPTITSAMTGYNANVQSYFDTGSSKVPLSTRDYFRRAIYHVKDADRITSLNLTKSYIVGSKGFGYAIERMEYDYFACLEYGARSNGDCALALAISQYIAAYPLRTSQSNDSYLVIPAGSDISSHKIESPTLDIEVFSTKVIGYSYTPSTVSSLSTGPGATASELPLQYTTKDGVRTYSAPELNENGRCDSQTNYMWGFSFLLLTFFFITTGIWALGMYVTWNDTFWNSRLDREGRQMGFYRGVADMSNAMWKDMLWEPSELAPERKIKEMLRAQKNGGRIKFEGFEHDKLPVPRIHAFRSWRNQVPSLHGWTEPWKALHWVWFIVLSSIDAITWLMGVFGLQVTALQIYCVVVGSILASIPGTMLLVGIAGAACRWTRRLVHSIPRPPHRHTMVPLFENSPEMRPVDRIETPR